MFQFYIHCTIYQVSTRILSWFMYKRSLKSERS